MSATSSERNAQRRKLLKRAAVAPAIFVLPTGTVLANSSINACVDKGLVGVTEPPLNPIPEGEWDQWVRQYEVGGSDPGSPPGNYLRRIDGKPVAGASCWNSINPGELADPGTNLIP